CPVTAAMISEVSTLTNLASRASYPGRETWHSG
ncbi:unnamed protein product, partial [marine sediment metagenome]